MNATTNEPISTDVLIVGAGPAGLALRRALDRLGVDSVLVDRHAAGLNTSRAAVIHARTLEVLEPLGVVPALLAEGLKTPDFCVREGRDVLLRIGFAGLPSPHPYALMCPQNVTEAVLAAGFGTRNATVWRPARLVSFKEVPGGIAAELDCAEAGLRQVHARWIVGCDGARSDVRAGAGIAFEGGDYAERFALADVRMDWPLPRSEVSLFFSPEGLMVVAPLPGGHRGGEEGADRYRIVATVNDPDPDPDPDVTLARVHALLGGRGPRPGTAPAVKELLWGSSFQVQHRVAAQVWKGRVLLCGDAAHVHSPAGGQGMNTGIQDAVELAAPLHRALRDGDTGGLAAWSARRHVIAREVVRTTDALTRLATASSPLARTARGALLGLVDHLPFVRRRLAMRLAELDR